MCKCMHQMTSKTLQSLLDGLGLELVDICPKKCLLQSYVDLSPDTKASHTVFMKAQSNCKKHTAEFEELLGVNKLQKKTAERRFQSASEFKRPS